MFYQDTVEKLLEYPSNRLKEGQIVIGPLCVCESGAGFYIGRWCIEKIEGCVVPQPYERVTGYMSREAADRELKYQLEAQ